MKKKGSEWDGPSEEGGAGSFISLFFSFSPISISLFLSLFLSLPLYFFLFLSLFLSFYLCLPGSRPKRLHVWLFLFCDHMNLSFLNGNKRLTPASAAASFSHFRYKKENERGTTLPFRCRNTSTHLTTHHSHASSSYPFPITIPPSFFVSRFSPTF